MKEVDWIFALVVMVVFQAGQINCLRRRVGKLEKK